ncbi:ribosome maturation factor RimM [Tindallia californiensis]|uniref:Ribosome maturation factor RimM n=1 Tax=Tindallia californiensis TaxID=159292 RepID=A0A1H3NUA9_9FIRM|nr:ribosome maturation factor RimM [Tindallia californiensis]SDY92035.1 16S rRNA processing protein RimM [Tindallia californiensis]
MEFLKVGVVTNAHGINGGMKVKCLADELERFLELEWLYVGETHMRYDIENVKIRSKDLLLYLSDIETMNKALELKGSYLYTDKSQRHKLEEDQFYIADLIGMKVFDVNHCLVGHVEKINSSGAQDILVVKSQENKEYLIPNVKAFVKKISVEEGFMIIEPIEGLIT